ncbi:MAG: SUMF1/EgtB/PvdO family nonheme iron enzyme [Desulfuromonadaceae bacterium]|nr:SUMF1/EgtB/PvdO family nonheme iron enzyme [Desulfuromonadaceae bacterium]
MKLSIFIFIISSFIATTIYAADFFELQNAIAQIKKINDEIKAINSENARKQLDAEKLTDDNFKPKYRELFEQFSSISRGTSRKTSEETENAYVERTIQQQKLNERRLAELTAEKISALEKVHNSFKDDYAKLIAPLNKELKILLESGYPLDPDSLILKLGAYNPKTQQFPVTIENRVKKSSNISVDSKSIESTTEYTASPVIAIESTLFLPKVEADKLSRLYRKNSGVLRPEIRVRASGEIANAVIVNEAEQYSMELIDGEFMTAEENEWRRTERNNEPLAGRFVRIPGGCFRMGDLFGGGGKVEKPVHEVCLSRFAIGVREVTQGQWKRIMGINNSKFKNCGDDCPVEGVSWYDSQEFIGKLNQLTGKNYRLPTEAEWEYAARSGGRMEKFSGGDKLDILGWYRGNSDKMTHSGGKMMANGLGIFDMSGNVWEWVGDFYGEYSKGKQLDPTGPLEGSARVSRGGSWGSDSTALRTTNRIGSSPDNRHNVQGFRLALPMP